MKKTSCLCLHKTVKEKKRQKDLEVGDLIFHIEGMYFYICLSIIEDEEEKLFYLRYIKNGRQSFEYSNIHSFIERQRRIKCFKKV